ncbi:alpha/beta hydrolase domain-containing protein [Actinokineospora iranica]|uniref:alpha/beta hydrolase domain-containing protein n=1 Tax=Actinokineospora iranica TaxID=1271860 RepID=UPI001113BB38|nr:alpha/beta hydrolase domain-containing protein [Actinokineospora iranica]
MRIAVAAVAAVGLIGGVHTAGAAQTEEGPTVTPIAAAAGKGHPVAGVAGLADLPGYTELEYLMSGEADTYQQDGSWTENGKWATRVASQGNSYTTRLLVERPTDPAKFNGTVIVEWLNVSFGVDIPVDLSQSYEHFTRAGYAYVGVTAQKRGADKLRALDPARYPGVDISDDALSYDILTQAAQAVRTRPELLGGATPSVVLASGHSQSAGRLTTYANAIQPTANAFDGFLVHGRGGGAAPISTGVSAPARAKIRTDLRVPVFVLQSETDIVTSAAVRQNTERVRTWEVAGTAHADKHGLDLYDAINARDHAINDGAPTTCDKPVNNMPSRYAQNAAYHHLDQWVRRGVAPPVAPMIESLFGVFVVRDGDQNARGGVRLPDLDAPVATYAPRNSGGNVLGACLLLGSTTPFSPARLTARYPDHDAYVRAFTTAADRARDAGYLLPQDHAEALARARAADIP